MTARGCVRSACGRWQTDCDAYLQKEGMIEPLELCLDRPAKVTATTTFSPHKTAAGWRITGVGVGDADHWLKGASP